MDHWSNYSDGEFKVVETENKSRRRLAGFTEDKGILYFGEHEIGYIHPAWAVKDSSLSEVVLRSDELDGPLETLQIYASAIDLLKKNYISFDFQGSESGRLERNIQIIDERLALAVYAQE